jgi:hypothetical protein
MMRRLILLLGAAIFFAVASAVTQIGGVVFVGAVLFARALQRWGFGKSGAFLAGTTFFLVTTPILNLYVVPTLAARAGREALPCAATAERPYAALSPLYCGLARNYVRSEAKAVLEAMASDLARQYPGLIVAYLDTGFPFFDGFPLPPHLSHDDGRRIDLAYFYKDGSGRAAMLTTPSPLGYWGFEATPEGETPLCADKVRWLTFRWDMGWFQSFVRRDLVLDEERTAAMLRWLTEQGQAQGVEKILLEPHMAKRLQVVSPLIRFQGCRAARHDDHIHFEVAARPR